MGPGPLSRKATRGVDAEGGSMFGFLRNRAPPRSTSHDSKNREVGRSTRILGHRVNLPRPSMGEIPWGRYVKVFSLLVAVARYRVLMDYVSFRVNINIIAEYIDL